MERKYIDILFKIGESLSLDNESRQTLTKIDDGYYINYSENWKNYIIESLEDAELINVFKGLIIAEQCYNQLCGSTTVGKFLYREIEGRNLDKDLQIANWAYINTRNGYIPFDSDGSIRGRSMDAYEFIRNRESLTHQIEIEKIYKEARVLNEQINGLKNKILKQSKEINELKERLSLSLMTNVEIAQIIIKDNNRPVYFYCYEIERIITDKSVDKRFLENILEKFKNNEKRNIKILKDKLLQEINNR